MTSEDIQRRHYEQTASDYDGVLGRTPEHEFALYILLSFIDSLSAGSLLDVGAGTGRGLRFLMEHRPNMIVRGVEPVEELRSEGYRKGIPADWLVAGSGYQLPFADSSFDIVTEFGVLHHVKEPQLLVREMVRVARYGVLLSDTNNLGQGGLVGRLIKTLAYRMGLWRVLSLIRTRGRGYISEPNDGLWYYYTVFSHFAELKRLCHSVHVMNTRRTSMNPMFSASHAVILATKSAVVDSGSFFTHLRD